MSACAEPAPEVVDGSFYALVEGIDGVYFHPPLGPEPAASGTFDATLLDGLSVTLESEDAAGALSTLASFDATTQPAIALLAERERYFVNIPAAAYLADPALTYRVRVALDGTEIGSSVLSGHVFTVLGWNPSLPIGVHVRIEGTGAVRNVRRAALHGPTGTPRHCTDGIRNKDETGVDCGGGCAPCCAPTPELCDGIDNDCDGAIDDGAELSCPDAANASPTCSSATCGFTCNAGYADCDGLAGDGCEARLASDPMNCGACRHSCGAGTACVLGACTASEASFSIAQSCATHAQRCLPAAGPFVVQSAGHLSAQFSTPPTHCSSIAVELLLDGQTVWSSGFLGAGQSTGYVALGAVSPGAHTMSVIASGTPGGCNSGWVASWGGTLSVRTY